MAGPAAQPPPRDPMPSLLTRAPDQLGASRRCRPPPRCTQPDLTLRGSEGPARRPAGRSPAPHVSRRLQRRDVHRVLPCGRGRGRQTGPRWPLPTLSGPQGRPQQTADCHLSSHTQLPMVRGRPRLLADRPFSAGHPQRPCSGPRDRPPQGSQGRARQVSDNHQTAEENRFLRSGSERTRPCADSR